METSFPNGSVDLVQQRIAEEERRYREALNDDVPFRILKEIRNQIKILKAQFTKKDTQ